MKFGKQLAKVVALSDPEWAPFWVSYKALKKRVKELTDSPPPGTQPRDAGTGAHGHHATPATNTEPNPKELAQSAGEVAFFRTLRAEVAKASEFYLGMEQQMGARRRRIKMGLQYLKQPTTVLEDDAWIKMRRACISLYKDLLLLENFAVMNYCGTCWKGEERRPSGFSQCACVYAQASLYFVCVCVPVLSCIVLSPLTIAVFLASYFIHTRSPPPPTRPPPRNVPQPAPRP